MTATDLQQLWDATHEFASPATAPQTPGASPKKAPPQSDTSSSSQPSPPYAPPGRSARDRRLRSRRGHPIAIVAAGAKMAKLFWHLLVREQDYAYTLPTPLAKKIRTIELKAGRERRRGGDGKPVAINREQRRMIERQIAEYAQAAYERTIADWQRAAAAKPKTIPART